MDKYEYDVIMKVLEIMTPRRSDNSQLSEEQRRSIYNVVNRIYGDVLIGQTLIEEVSMDFGDKFENINNSIIATRGSVAKGVIRIREGGQEDLAAAFGQLDKALHETSNTDISPEAKEEAYHLLDALTKEAASPRKSKSVLKTLGSGLWEGIKNVEPIAKAISLAWPVIERLWK